MIEELCARTFAIRDAAHKAHWRTKSYAQHMALGALYVGAVEALDAIVEAWEGVYGLIGEFEPEPVSLEDIAALLEAEHDWIDSNREEITQGSSCVGNLLDDLTALYAKTLYLLRLS